jgi:hypothetical protein
LHHGRQLPAEANYRQRRLIEKPWRAPIATLGRKTEPQRTCMNSEGLGSVEMWRGGVEAAHLVADSLVRRLTSHTMLRFHILLNEADVRS